MYTQLLIILGLIFGGMLHLSESQNTTCPNTCILQARCNPYSKNLVWTVIDNVCRVFQNGCIFGNENCMRANQCLPPMIRTTREHCMAFCPRMCYRNWPPVCGWFPYTNSNGTTGEHYRTFGTRCFLNLYACQNAEAYVNEPRTGPCP